jgi:hypothetical protein
MVEIERASRVDAGVSRSERAEDVTRRLAVASAVRQSYLPQQGVSIRKGTLLSLYSGIGGRAQRVLLAGAGNGRQQA